MCLSRVVESYENEPLTDIKFGYKVFGGSFNTFYGLYISNGPMRVGKWYIDCNEKKLLTDQGFQRYLSGYHIYSSLNAIGCSVKTCKVKFTDITVLGKNLGYLKYFEDGEEYKYYDCYVARKMMIIDTVDNLAKKIESDAAYRAYDAGLGVSEWESFLTEDETKELVEYADFGFGT
mgnify:FL=1